MRTPPRMRPDLLIVRGPQEAEVTLSLEGLAAATGLSPARLVRLVRLGCLEPAAPGAREFTAATAVRLRRMLRLHRDLGVNLAGAAIIVDLVERLDRLEAQLARGRGAR